MECEVQFIDSGEHELDLQGFYEHFYSVEGPEGQRTAEGLVSAWRWRRQVRIVRALLPTGTQNRVLDIGCNSGQFLAALPADTEKYGVEASGRAADLARSKGIHVEHGLFTGGLYPDSFFSAVTAFAIIEHLIDPGSFLREVQRLLCHGGILAIMTGDPSSWRARYLGLKWALYTPPEHQFFFPSQSLDSRLRALSFDKIAHFYSAGGMVGTRIPLIRFALKGIYAATEFVPWMNRLPMFDHYYGYYRLNKVRG